MHLRAKFLFRESHKTGRNKCHSQATCNRGTFCQIPPALFVIWGDLILRICNWQYEYTERLRLCCGRCDCPGGKELLGTCSSASPFFNPGQKTVSSIRFFSSLHVKGYRFQEVLNANFKGFYFHLQSHDALIPNDTNYSVSLRGHANSQAKQGILTYLTFKCRSQAKPWKIVIRKSYTS